MRFNPFRRFKYHILVAFLIVVAYQVLLSPAFLENRIKNYFEAETTASIDLDIKRSSLLFGFDIRDLNIETHENVPIFKASRIHLSWFTLSMLAGHIGIREAGLYDAEIYLLEKDGSWNYEALLAKKSGAETEEKADTVDESTELPDFIPTILPLKLYGSIKLNNTAFFYESENNNRKQKFSVENLDTRIAFISETFTSVPLDQTAVELFETLVVAINPFRPVQIEYTDAGTLKGPLEIDLRMFRRVDDAGTSFSSQLNLNSSNMSFYRPGYFVPPPALKLSYDTYYQHDRDLLEFRDFHLAYGDDVWLALKGEIQKILNGPQRIELAVKKSRINLRPPGLLVSALTDNNIRFGGTASLLPLVIEGTPENLYLEGKLSGRNIYFYSGSQHNIPRLDFRIVGRVNLYENVAFLKPPEYYTAEENLAFDVIRVLKIDQLEAMYNGSTLSGKASILPGQGVLASVDLRNFNLGALLAPTVTGFGSAKLDATSDLSFEKIDIKGNINVAGGRYAIGRSLSGINHLNLNADVLLDLQDGLLVNLKSVNLQGKNAAGGPFLNLQGASIMRFKNGQSYQVNLQKLDLSYNDAYQTFPGSIRALLSPYKVYLQKGIELSSNTTIQTGKTGTQINGTTELRLPSLGQEPININKNVMIGENQLSFPSVKIDGLRGALSASLNGRLYQVNKNWKPDLKLNLNIERDTMLPVHENISLRGSLKLNAIVNPQLATGGLYIKNLGLRYYKGNCIQPDQPECYQVSVEGLNLDLPIKHDMNMLNPEVIGASSVNQSVQTFRPDPNFTLKYVRASHRPDGNFAEDGFYFVGANIPSLPAGLAARMDYRNNVLMIDWLDSYAAAPVRKDDQLQWKPRGRISGKRIFFNTADLDPKNMEFGAFIQAHNLDLEPYFGTGEASYDGIISADARAYGRNLSDVIRTTNARVAVHRISDDFTGFAVRLFLPNPILASGVNNVLEIPSLRAELRGGLVYTSIQVKSPGPFSLARVIRPTEEEIKQERIPIAQFLERARTEAEAFQPGVQSE